MEQITQNDGTNAKLATLCPHTDEPEKAKGLCAKCYRAQRKAVMVASNVERTTSTSDDRNEKAALRDLERDPDAKRVFYDIMWKWLKESEVPAVYKNVGGKRERDYTTELRLGELAQRKADKAATVLGRAYVTEKREEVKPVPLPLGGEVDTSGWEDEEEGEIDDQD